MTRKTCYSIGDTTTGLTNNESATMLSVKSNKFFGEDFRF